MALLRAEQKWANPYEQMHDTLKGTSALFNDDDWKYVSNNGGLDMYIGLLNANEGREQEILKSSKFFLPTADIDYRLAVLNNEAVMSDNELKAKDEETRRRRSFSQFYKDKTGNIFVDNRNEAKWKALEEQELTDYEYNKILLEQQGEYYQYLYDQEKAAENKKNMSGWQKVGTFLAQPFVSFFKQGIGAWQSIIDVFEGIGTYVFGGGSAKEREQRFREAFMVDPENLEGLNWLTDRIEEWELRDAVYRNVDGSYTNAYFEMIDGIAGSFGQMLATAGLGGLAGKAVGAIGGAVGGTAGKVLGTTASTIAKVSNALYYTSMAGENMQQYMADANFATTETWKLVLNSTLKAAAEYGVQKGLKAFLGRTTMMDRAFFGEKTLHSFTKKAIEVSTPTTKGALQTIFADAVHEGLEETLQQFSGSMIDSFFAISDRQFINDSTWNLETFGNAFVLGAISSGIASSLSVAVNGIDSRYQIHKGTYDGPVDVNALVRWQYSNQLRDMIQLTHEFVTKLQKGKLSSEQVVIGMSSISDMVQALMRVYGEIGPERMQQAVDMLVTLNDYAENHSFAKTETQAHNFVIDKIANVTKGLEDAKLEYKDRKIAEEAKKLVEDLTADTPKPISKDTKTVVDEAKYKRVAGDKGKYESLSFNADTDSTIKYEKPTLSESEKKARAKEKRRITMQRKKEADAAAKASNDAVTTQQELTIKINKLNKELEKRAAEREKLESEIATAKTTEQRPTATTETSRKVSDDAVAAAEQKLRDDEKREALLAKVKAEQDLKEEIERLKQQKADAAAKRAKANKLTAEEKRRIAAEKQRLILKLSREALIYEDEAQSALEKVKYDYDAALELLGLLPDVDSKKAPVQKVESKKIEDEENRTIARSPDSVAAAIVATGATSVTTTIDAKTDWNALGETLGADVRNQLRKFYDFVGRDYTVIVTADGAKVVTEGDLIIVPINAIKANAKDALLAAVEYKFRNKIRKSSLLRRTIPKVQAIYFQLFNTEVSQEGAIAELLYNDLFMSRILGVMDKDIVALMNVINSTIESFSSDDKVDLVAKARLKQVRDVVSAQITKFCLDNPRAYFIQQGLVTDPVAIKTIYTRDRAIAHAESVIQNGLPLNVTKLKYDIAVKSGNDYAGLINGLTIPDNDKRKLWDKLTTIGVDENAQLKRLDAIKTIDLNLNNRLYGEYNGIIYLPSTSLQNNLFNEFLRSKRMTLLDLERLWQDDRAEFDTIVYEWYGSGYTRYMVQYNPSAPYGQRFTVYDTHPYSSAKVSLLEQEVYHSESLEDSKSPYNYDDIQFAKGIADAKEKLSLLTNEDTDIFTLTDLIYEPSLMKPELYEKYKASVFKKTESDDLEVSPSYAYRFLKREIVDQTGDTSIEYDDLNIPHFVSIELATNIYKDPNWYSKIKDAKDIDRKTMRDFLRDDLKDSDLGNVKIRVTNDRDGGYEDGVIYVPRMFGNKVVSGKLLRYIVTHEFQHAVQDFNHLNRGLVTNFTKRLSKDNRRRILKEFLTGMPDLFNDIIRQTGQIIEADGSINEKGASQALKRIDQFLYTRSGESSALGFIAQDLSYDFPVVVKVDGGKLTLTLPTGGVYVVEQPVSQKLELREDSVFAEQAKKVFETARKELEEFNPLRPNKGFILVDGSIGFFDAYELTHPEVIQQIVGSKRNRDFDYFTAHVLMNEAIQITNDVTQRIFRNGRIQRVAAFSKYNNLTIRMLMRLNYAQYKAIINFIDHWDPANGDLLLGDAYNNRASVSFNEWTKEHDGVPPSAREMINEYLRQFRRNNSQHMLRDEIDSSINYTQMYDGQRYITFLDNFNEQYDKVFVEGDHQQVGMVLPNGEFGFTGDRAVIKQFMHDSIYQPQLFASESLEKLIKYESAKIIYSDGLLELTLPENLSSAQIETIRMLIQRAWADYLTVNIYTNSDELVFEDDHDESIDVVYDLLTDIAAKQADTEYLLGYRSASLNRMHMAARRTSADTEKDSTSIQIHEHVNKKGQSTYYKVFRVTKKNSADTNLTYFVGKDIHPDTAKFVVNADQSRLEPEVWQMIVNGTLTKPKAIEYMRETKDINDYTFRLMAECFFGNYRIKSQQELDDLMDFGLDTFYALRAVMRDLHWDDLLNKPLSMQGLELARQAIEHNPDVKSMYEAIRGRFDTYKGKPLSIKDKNAKIGLLRYFDGTIERAGYVASIAKFSEINEWSQAGNIQTTSGDETRGYDKHGEDGQTLFDRIADTRAEESFEALFDEVPIEKMIDDILEVSLEKIRQMGKNPSAAVVNALRSQIESKDNDTIRAMYSVLETAQMASAKAVRERYASMNVLDKVKAKPKRRPAGIKQNIRNIVARMRKHMSAHDTRRFMQVEENQTYFNDDVTIKDEYLNTDDIAKLEEIENLVRRINQDVRTGMYTSQLAVDTIKRLQRKNQRLTKKVEKANGVKTVVQPVLLNDRVFTIGTSVEMPDELMAILETTFEEFSRSHVQHLDEVNEAHLKMSYRNFLTQNAERLHGMDAATASNIIDFYMKSSLLPGTELTEQLITKYETYKMYVLAFIYRNADEFDLSYDQRKFIRDTMHLDAHLAGTKLKAWGQVLHEFDTASVVMQALAAKFNIEFDEDLLKELDATVKTGNVKKITEARNKLLNDALTKYKGHKKSFLEKMWRFQRLAMLSSPGTWVRNITSNFIVEAGNKLSSTIGHKLSQISKKYRRDIDDQYELHGIKVNEDVKRFIDKQILDSGLFNLIEDGFNKFDRDAMRKKRDGVTMTVDNRLVEAIRTSIEYRIIGSYQFDSKLLQRGADWLGKMLSDNWWINRRTISLFGRILQQAVDTGYTVTDGDGNKINTKVDLSRGLTTDVVNMFADAYAEASWEYMHKTNWVHDVEHAIRKRFGDKGMFLYKQIFPFAASSWNWFMEMMNYTPFGIMKGIMQLHNLEKTIDKMDTQRQTFGQGPTSKFARYIAERNLGKGVIGSILIGLGMILGGLGIAVVDEEDEKIKLKLADNFMVDITSIFGSSSLLVGVALMNPAKGSFEEAFANVVDTLFNDSIFSDMYNQFEFSDNIGDWFINKPSDMLGTFVPNFLKALVSTTYNHEIDYHSGILGGLEYLVVSSIPGIAYALPKRYDPFTGELQTKYKVPFIMELINRFSPVKIYSYDVSEVERIALGLGLQKGELTGRYQDIGTLGTADTAKLNEYYGQLNKAELAKLINNNQKYRVLNSKGKYEELYFSRMTDEQKRSVIDRIMADNAKIAKIYIYTSNGGKYYASSSEYDELKKYGIKNLYKETTDKKGFM